jgi:hypothetical protein
LAPSLYYLKSRADNHARHKTKEEESFRCVYPFIGNITHSQPTDTKFLLSCSDYLLNMQKNLKQFIKGKRFLIIIDYNNG